MTKCKPGDLAIVLRGASGADSRHTGKIVTVVELYRAESIFGPVWIVETRSPEMGCLVNSKTGQLNGIGAWSTRHGCPDAWLRPIKPDAEPLDENEVRELFASAGIITEAETA